MTIAQRTGNVMNIMLLLLLFLLLLLMMIVMIFNPTDRQCNMNSLITCVSEEGVAAKI